LVNLDISANGLLTSASLEAGYDTYDDESGDEMSDEDEDFGALTKKEQEAFSGLCKTLQSNQ
jgi:hypothetical protein